MEDCAMAEMCRPSQALDVGAVNNLKKKVIKEYEKYLHNLFKGYKNDYCFILNEISFIESYDDLDNQRLIYEYYINHGV